MKQELLTSTQKGWSASKQAGFSSVEALLAASVFAMLVTALIGAYLYGQEATALSGNRTRAVMLAEEGLEAVKNIRDAGFANLVDGTYGITTTGNQYNLSGASDTNGIFTRAVNIATVGVDKKSVNSSVTWQQNAQRPGVVSLDTYLTYWQKPAPAACVNQASFLDVNTVGAILTASNRRLSGITIGSSATNCDIVINTIQLTWTTANRRLAQIDINGGSVWTGSVTSGTINNVTDFTITPSQTGITTEYRFNNSVAGSTFTITYTMLDGTTKVVTGITP